MNAYKGTYILKELDESVMKGTVNGSRLKHFDSRAELNVDNEGVAADARSEDMDEDGDDSSAVIHHLRPRRRSDGPAVEEVILPSLD